MQIHDHERDIPERSEANCYADVIFSVYIVAVHFSHHDEESKFLCVRVLKRLLIGV